MTRAIVPIGELNRRIPEAGRIRFGVKTTSRNGKTIPVAIDRFRFTSHDQAALEQIANLYGGTVAPWSDPKAADGQFEVVTDAGEIRIVLPPDPLGGTPIYERWGGGGCDRRCDGLTCETLVQGPDGVEPVQKPCPCAAEGAMSCEPHTRLSVILPEIRFGGAWRLETKSWNAAQELPGMVDMIRSLQERGLPYATLALKHRQTVTAGQTKKFIVPVLGLPQSVEELAAGRAQLGSIEAPATTAGELGAGEPVADGFTLGEQIDGAVDVDEIVDAELVDDDEDLPAARAQLKEHLNALDGQARGQFRERFGHPDQLDAARMLDAIAFVAELEARQGDAAGPEAAPVEAMPPSDGEGAGAADPPEAPAPTAAGTYTVDDLNLILADTKGVGPVKALKRYLDLAAEHGVPEAEWPDDLDQLQPGPVLDALCAWLLDQQPDPDGDGGSGPGVAGPGGGGDAAPGPAAAPAAEPAPEPDAVPVARARLNRMHALAGQAWPDEKPGMDDQVRRQRRLDLATFVCGRSIDTTTHLTDLEAEQVIEALEAIVDGRMELWRDARGAWKLRNAVAKGAAA